MYVAVHLFSKRGLGNCLVYIVTILDAEDRWFCLSTELSWQSRKAQIHMREWVCQAARETRVLQQQEADRNKAWVC